MQYLSISKRKAGSLDGDVADLREAETERARALYLEGHLRQIWHRGDMPGACLVWEADSEQQVREWLATLPFLAAGLIDVVIVPLKPYAGFGPRPASV